ERHPGRLIETGDPQVDFPSLHTDHVGRNAFLRVQPYDPIVDFDSVGRGEPGLTDPRDVVVNRCADLLERRLAEALPGVFPAAVWADRDFGARWLALDGN